MYEIVIGQFLNVVINNVVLVKICEPQLSAIGHGFHKRQPDGIGAFCISLLELNNVLLQIREVFLCLFGR